MAYLIMAHDQPEQLHRLVNVLQCDWAKFYIHIDKKTEIAPFLKLMGHRNDVQFIEARVKANWMGFSLVQATMNLMKSAMMGGFDYCTLLSGADYPVKPLQDIYSFFDKAENEYIAFWRLEDRPGWQHKVEYFYLVDKIPIRNYMEKNPEAYWRRFFWGRFFKYRHLMPKRKFLPGLVPFGGPDWWSLSSSCVKYVLDYVEKNRKFSNFYRYTSSPGEMFFQTIILNSPYANKVENSGAYWKWSESRVAGDEREMLPDEDFNLRYVDWSGEISGKREAPAVLFEEDWQNISSTKALFARKFHCKKSLALQNRIDHEIMRQKQDASC